MQQTKKKMYTKTLTHTSAKKHGTYYIQYTTIVIIIIIQRKNDSQLL